MKDLKKVGLWIAIVVGIVVAVDLLFGLAMKKYISTYRLKGDYRAVDHILTDSDDDELMVLGSSVALNSINTKTLEDSLGIKIYNGGSNGQTMPYYQTLLEIIAGRPKLKTVIMGLAEINLTDHGTGVRYRFLVPYYDTGYKPIDERLEGMSAMERVFLKSSLYRYNTMWFRILLYHFFEPGIKGANGFIAKDIPAFYPHKEILEQDMVMSDERACQLDSMAELCRKNGIRLIVCMTPRYEQRNIETDVERNLRSRAARGDFELWFDIASTPLSADSTMFYDNTHLNYKGAEIYTSTIIERLKNESRHQ